MTDIASNKDKSKSKGFINQILIYKYYKNIHFSITLYKLRH